MLRLRVRVAKCLNRLPHEIDEMTADDFWSVVAEFKLENDEFEEKRNG